MMIIEIRSFRILHLIILSIISAPLILFTIHDLLFFEPGTDYNVNNPDQSALVAGIRHLFFMILLVIGSISGIISLVDLTIEKNKFSFINISLATIIILISFYIK